MAGTPLDAQSDQRPLGEEPQVVPAADCKTPSADARMAGDGGDGAAGGLELEALGGAPKSEPPGRKDCLGGGPLPYQKEAETFYASFRVQVAVAGLIVTNFMVNIVQKQIDPRDGRGDLFEPFETFFNLVFFAELILNMYSCWFFRFWKNGWNRFDFLVVTIGMLDTCKVKLPEQLKFIRMLRAFRVFRLFARVESLNKIIVSLVHAVPGVANAFLIMTIVMAIYAILAVDLYQKVGVRDNGDGTSSCDDTFGSETFVSGRGRCVGEEYFGTFLASLYSLFQVLTGDSWSEAIARPVILVHPYSGPLFFLTFIILNAVVLINVVVAVLVDKIMSTANDTEGDDNAVADDPVQGTELADGVTPVADPASATDRPSGGGDARNAQGGDAGSAADAGSAPVVVDGSPECHVSSSVQAGGPVTVVRPPPAAASSRPEDAASDANASPSTILKERVSNLTGDTARLKEEVTQVSAALRSGLERTRADLGGLQAKLDSVLSALREAQTQPQ